MTRLRGRKGERRGEVPDHFQRLQVLGEVFALLLRQARLEVRVIARDHFWWWNVSSHTACNVEWSFHPCKTRSTSRSGSIRTERLPILPTDSVSKERTTTAAVGEGKQQRRPVMQKWEYRTISIPA